MKNKNEHKISEILPEKFQHPSDANSLNFSAKNDLREIRTFRGNHRSGCKNVFYDTSK